VPKLAPHKKEAIDGPSPIDPTHYSGVIPLEKNRQSPEWQLQRHHFYCLTLSESLLQMQTKLSTKKEQAQMHHREQGTLAPQHQHPIEPGLPKASMGHY
jgi:hypothetical protein